jgi:hypothetical protein
MYYDYKDKIFKLKYSLQESQALAPIMILIISFWSLNIVVLHEELPQKSVL